MSNFKYRLEKFESFDSLFMLHTNFDMEAFLDDLCHRNAVNAVEPKGRYKIRIEKGDMFSAEELQASIGEAVGFYLKQMSEGPKIATKTLADASDASKVFQFKLLQHSMREDRFMLETNFELKYFLSDLRYVNGVNSIKSKGQYRVRVEKSGLLSKDDFEANIASAIDLYFKRVNIELKE